MKKTILAAMLIAGTCSFALAQGGGGGGGGEPPSASDPHPPGALLQQPGGDTSNPQAMRRGDQMQMAPVRGTDPGVPTGERSPANNGAVTGGMNNGTTGGTNGGMTR